MKVYLALCWFVCEKFQQCRRDKWSMNSWWNIVYSSVKMFSNNVSMLPITADVKQWFEHFTLRFWNNKATSDEAYWSTLLNLYRWLLHCNNCKKVACSRWCQWGCDGRSLVVYSGSLGSFSRAFAFHPELKWEFFLSLSHWVKCESVASPTSLGVEMHIQIVNCDFIFK